MRVCSLALVASVVIVVVAWPEAGSAQEPDEPGALVTPPRAGPEAQLRAERPLRERRRLSFAALADMYLTPGAGVLPLPGLDFTLNFGPHLALDVSICSLAVFTTVSAGVRAYLLEHAVSPYIEGDGGVAIVALWDAEAAPLVSGVAGLELAVGAFRLFVDGGALYVVGGDAVVPRVRTGIGLRV